MRRIVSLFIVLVSIQFLSINFLSAQEIQRCATMEYLQQQEIKHPGTMQRIQDARAEAEQWMEQHPADTRTVMIIPVVVHVVYHTNPENISDQQIQSQIDVLNEDYNRLNADTFKTPDVWKPIAGSMSVQFCLAQYDPQGDSTSGITRTHTDAISFDTGDSVKHTNQGGQDAWPCTHYLNMWVCNLRNNVLGYGTLPTNGCDPDDGIVVQYNSFGRVGNLNAPYNKGRTATHEVGHWLGLTHPSGDDGGSCTGDDGCNDTPREADNVFGCPVFPDIDQCSGAPNGVMFMNYMDYTDDDCMNIFTQCQCNKMLSTLNSPQERQSVLSSPGGCQGLQYNLDAAISTIAFPTDTLQMQGFRPIVQLTNRGIDNITYVEVNYQVDGQPVSTSYYQGTLSSLASVPDTLPPYFTGEYGHVSNAWTANPNHSTDQFIYNDTASAPFFVRSTTPKNTTSVVVQQDASTDQPRITIINPSAAIMHLQVVNILGQVVQEGNWAVFNNSSFTVDLSNVPQGVYFLYGKIGYDFVKKKVMVLRK